MSTKKAFETENGNKQRCRDLLCLHAKTLPSVKKIITLPSRECLCIKTFKKSFPKANVIAIERDPEIFQEISDKGFNCVNSSVREYIHHQTLMTSHADIVFLDYYSYLHEDIMQDIRALLTNNNLVHKGKPSIIGLTLMKSMRGKHVQGLDFMRDNIYDGHRKEIENNIKNVQDAITNFITCEILDLEEFKFLEAFEYKADNNSTVMYFFIMKVIT